ncbi:MAG TPA: creatininase family protein [Candidatus Limnocylindrales bacterium]|nr:creatininase family protein [Candidatus Limnocylindrales bacterium]
MTENPPKFLWNEMNRLEIERAQKAGYMVIIPVGSIEQHGPHLPVDTDIHSSLEIAKRAALKRRDVLVCPPVWFGYSPHHMGFQGTLTLRLETFLDLLKDICDSLYHHGFKKILILNGHGGNRALINLVVNDFMRTHRTKILATSYWDLAADEIRAIRKSEPGGMGHACELETSLQLYLRPNLVDTSQISKETWTPKSRFGISYGIKDLLDSGSVTIGFDFAESTSKGIMGDPTVASVDTGEKIVAAVVDRLVDLLEEYKQL